MNVAERMILKYFGTCLLCLLISHHGVVCQLLKSEVFLTQDDIPGGEDGPAEYNIKEGPEESPPMSGLNPALLSGSYPQGGVDVPEYNEKHGNGEDDGKLKGRSFGDFNPVKHLFLDPIKDLVPNVAGGVVQGVKNVITGVKGFIKGVVAGGGAGAGGGEVSVGGGGGLQIGNLTIPGPGELIPKLMECGRKMLMCSLSNIFNVQCYLHCIFAAHPLGKEVMSSVTSIMNLLCKSIGTVFDEGIALFAKNIKKIKTVKHFFTLFRITSFTLKKYTRLAITSFPTMIIKYSKLPGCYELKTTINSLSAAAKTVNRGRSSINPTLNVGCKFIDQMDAVQQLVTTIFNKGAKVVDIVMSGFWTLKKLYVLLKEKILRHTVLAINYALNMVIGVKCNLLLYVLNGEQVDCPPDEVEIIPPIGEVVPPDSGAGEVCGSTPLVPRYIMDDIMPPIFPWPKQPQTERKPTQLQGKNPLTGETVNGTLTGPQDQDYEWVGSLLKTKDLEYDEE